MYKAEISQNMNNLFKSMEKGGDNKKGWREETTL